MLRILENCNHTYVICVLVDLLRKYKDDMAYPKLPNLIVKCLLKLSKIIAKVVDKLDLEKIFLSFHEFLLVINHDNKTQNDETGIKIIKTMLNELVQLKGNSIWEPYAVIRYHNLPDNYINKWITIILKSLNPETAATTSSGNSNTNTTAGGSSVYQMDLLDQQIKQLVNELKNPDKYEAAIPRLAQLLQEYPDIDIDYYIQQCSPTF